MTNTVISSADDVNARAAHWHARLRADDCSALDRTAFEQWCVDDPANIDAWLAISDLHESVTALRDDPAMRNALRSARGHATKASSNRNWWLGMAATLVMSIVAAGWFAWPRTVPGLQIATRVGEQREVTLTDGTALMLDTDSSVVARLDDLRRQIEVERGRVSIIVAKDAAERPFEVLAGPGRVRDIGTEFQVQRDPAGVAVTLIEGIVAISVARSGHIEQLLDKPGQRLRYEADGRVGTPTHVDPDAARDWTRGQIILDNQPLDELLVRLNRYLATPLRLANAADGKTTISGVFNVGDLDSLLRALESEWGFRVSKAPSGEIILARRAR